MPIMTIIAEDEKGHGCIGWISSHAQD